jgi:hypothetical protein
MIRRHRDHHLVLVCFCIIWKVFPRHRLAFCPDVPLAPTRTVGCEPHARDFLGHGLVPPVLRRLIFCGQDQLAETAGKEQNLWPQLRELLSSFGQCLGGTVERHSNDGVEPFFLPEFAGTCVESVLGICFEQGRQIAVSRASRKGQKRYHQCPRDARFGLDGCM